MEKRKRSTILDTAKQTICHDRQDQYGDPKNNFQVIAEFWQTYLTERCARPGVSVNLVPDDVANLMVLLKMARICTGTVKEDNYVDLIGYAALGAEMATAESLHTIETTYFGKARKERSVKMLKREGTWRRFELTTDDPAQKEELDKLLDRLNLSRRELALIVMSLRVRPKFSLADFDA